MNANKEIPTIICLTPIKNEVWILDKFLKATSLWADYIIVADQMSTDGSREICQQYEKVILIDNNSAQFNEPERQKLLINEARKIEGPRLLIALDADEMFSPNLFFSEEWQTVLSAKPGTLILSQLTNILPGITKMYYDIFVPIGFMDDGSDHEGKFIHSCRLPAPSNKDKLYLHEIKLIHFQFADSVRMLSKHRWYQCFEKVKITERLVVDIFRIYNYVHFVDASSNNVDMSKSWIQDYSARNIDITSICVQSLLWWDKQVLDYMDQYGTRYFAHLNIWDVSWVAIAEKWGYPNPEKYKDPRNKLEKLINRWLILTQSKKNNFWIVQLDKILKLFYK